MYEIKTTSLLKKIMSDYFQSFHNKSTPVAWCTSVGPAELLRSFGFEVYFPENHGALLGASRTSGDFIPEAAKNGYSGDICSYLTSDIGSFLKKQTPLTKQYGLDSIPKPDLIVYNTNQCREVQDWFSFYAREFDCPIYGIVPPRYVGNITEEEVTDVVAQFKGMISVCENVTGKNFDIDRFRDTVRLSKLATMAWKDVLNTARHSPSPLSFFDGVIHMGPIVVLRGTQTAVDYYIKLLEELNTNQKKGSGILDKENCRVYWEGMPIWGKLRSLSELFLRHRTAVVASTY